jgi:hypothetical protein
MANQLDHVEHDWVEWIRKGADAARVLADASSLSGGRRSDGHDNEGAQYESA